LSRWTSSTQSIVSDYLFDIRTGIIKLHKHRSPSQESRLAIGGSSEQAVERAWIWPAEAWRGVTKLVWEDSDLTHAGPAAGGRTRGQRRRRRRQTSRRQRSRTTTGSGTGARDWPPPGLRLPRRRAGTRTRARVMRISSGCRGSWADAEDRGPGFAKFEF